VIEVAIGLAWVIVVAVVSVEAIKVAI